MKKYCVCEDVNSCDTSYLVAEKECEKGDLVVSIEYDTPTLSKIVEFVDELEAITSERTWFEALAIVSVKSYFEKRKKDIEKARLIKMMKEQIELQKLEDTLKKNSECNEKMASLYNSYKMLCE